MKKELYPKQYLYKRVAQAKHFIDDRFSEPLALEDIAGAASLSKFHFIRLFKKCYGLPPHHYLMRARLANAKLQLQNGKTISEVCAAVGFTSLSSFTRLFKRQCGRTPSAYQAEHQASLVIASHSPFRFIPNCFAERRGLVQKSNPGQMKF